jgi:hypothetical protein
MPTHQEVVSRLAGHRRPAAALASTFNRRLGYCVPLLLAAAPAWACSSSFEDYFARFQRSRAAQEAGTWYPLRVHAPSGNRCHPDCEIVAYDYNRQDIRSMPEAIYPLPAERAARGMTIRKTVRTDRVTVHVGIEESDAFRGTYLFRRINGCWQLVQIN